MLGNRLVKPVIFLAICLIAAGITAADTNNPRIGMEVECLDAGLRRLPNNEFVHGERIIIRVRLLNYTALEATDQYDKQRTEYVRAQAERKAVEKPQLDLEKVAPPIALGTRGAPWTERVEFLWGTGDKSNAVQPLAPTWLPDHRGQGEPAEQLSVVTDEYWELDSGQLPTGEVSIAARFPTAETDPQGRPVVLEEGAEITLKSSATAAPQEMARIRLHEADAALESGNFDEAISLAKAAIDIGPENHVDLASLHIILGEGYQGNGEYENALVSFEEALRIAEEYFPGRSQIPAIMRSNIERMKSMIGSDRE